MVTVTAVDSSGTNTATPITVNITVTAVNESPSFTTTGVDPSPSGKALRPPRKLYCRRF